ncbi:MAG: ligase-associated DNA damage response exonuclease [Planctomycetes bacterium]|nr:ligase-associated DNA damage response exonuclease [Planctomycetota bacterium]
MRIGDGDLGDLLQFTPAGIFCERGGFSIDPSRRVSTAVITHAHGDHARRGSPEYFCARSGAGLLRQRLGRSAAIRAVEFGERFRLGDVAVSLHPAGHLLGSSQVRVEHGGEVWVVSGDYRRQPDPSCEPFEVVPCDVFITEATFGLPAFRWRPGEEVAREMFEWWEENRLRDRPSIIIAYALGKSQRILAELARFTERRVFVQESIEPLVACYRRESIHLLPTEILPRKAGAKRFGGELILAPPTCRQPSWLGRFPSASTAMASGWMASAGGAARMGVDRGFALSDHADWEEIIQTVRDSGARRVLVTHGYAEELASCLREQGLDARAARW